jgi:hypothetical protein
MQSINKKGTPMRQILYLAMPWFLFLGACSNNTQAAKTSKADVFSALVSHLPAGADVVVLVDSAELSQVFVQFLDDLEKTPVIAENPELLQMWKMQRTQLDGMLSSMNSRAGFDPMKDLHSAAVGLWLEPNRDPRFAAAVSGKFPKDILDRMEPDAPKRKIGSHQVCDMGDGMGVALVDDSLVLIAEMAGMEAVLNAKTSLADIKKRHPNLLAAFQKGLLFRFSVSIPDWVRAIGKTSAPGATTLLGLGHVDMDIGKDLRIEINTTTERAAENVKYLCEGLKEIMIGGRNLFRAYSFLAMGMDLGQLTDFPPPIRSALNNRKAILKTMEEYLGEFKVPPKVTAQGKTIVLSAPKEAMTGNAFIVGILAAIAVPAFITYTRRAKASEAQVDLMQQQMLEEAKKQGDTAPVRK